MDIFSRVVVGDMRELSEQIPSESVNCIFTDPPYPRTYWHLYDELAKVAARVLVPGGICFTYSGNDNAEYAMRALGAKLKYRAIMPCIHRHGQQIVWLSRYCAVFKPIFVHHKNDWLGDAPLLNPPARDTINKTFHEWGQSLEEAFHYLKHHTAPGDTVFDPFVGGGTTAVAAKMLGRKFIAFEIDPEAARIAQARIDAATEGVYQEGDMQLVSAQMELVF